jgi:hypothetical protein
MCHALQEFGSGVKHEYPIPNILFLWYIPLLKICQIQSLIVTKTNNKNLGLILFWTLLKWTRNSKVVHIRLPLKFILKAAHFTSRAAQQDVYRYQNLFYNLSTYFFQIYWALLVPIVARSETWVCGRSPAETVVSNTTGGHGCLSAVSVVCC